MVRGWPRVNLSESFTRTATAAIMRRHGGQPDATLSSFFEKYATGFFQGPSIWVSTPFATPLFSSTYNVKGLVISGRLRAGADKRAFLCCQTPAVALLSIERERWTS